ncbi:2,3-dihydro-2,3-dihydroxybenzoate dehydrogenase [Planosporangium thailandense]|uniref:2,3-dihydro-2,3-dihydroxybenzoate dehydrogenase n=1 Tax=Planosporangium thailandense TaxID=765197 RepID=A0ABX0XZW9_9ACTN|nr:2,3-dihydro-2,3-dihydroxybenzoate dehydrogenase [Planosporangium thailandense]
MTAEEFTGRVALVTGAAGGIGAAVVRTLAERGSRVAAVDLDAERLTGEAQRMRGKGWDVTALPADVSSGAAVTALVRTVENRLGPIDLLVNAAGILRPASALAVLDEDWAATFAVNATGVLQVSRAVAAGMVERRAGSIVTVASNAAGVPRSGMAAYAASKAAAVMYTKCLGLEVARYGVRCNVVAPGSTDTAMLRALWAAGGDARQTIAGSLSQFRVGIPLGKLATPNDVAETVAFLLSDRAGHITMQELYVDGGAALGV